MERKTFCLCCLAALGLVVLIASSCCGTPEVNKGGLSGSVFYYVSKTPHYVAGAIVHIDGTKTTTNSSGYYCRVNIDPSTYEVWAENPSRSSARSFITVVANKSGHMDFALYESKVTPTAGALDLRQELLLASRPTETPSPPDWP
jgi:hypothetical protein